MEGEQKWWGYFWAFIPPHRHAAIPPLLGTWGHCPGDPENQHERDLSVLLNDCIKWSRQPDFSGMQHRNEFHFFFFLPLCWWVLTVLTYYISIVLYLEILFRKYSCDFLNLIFSVFSTRQMRHFQSYIFHFNSHM